MLRPTLPGLLAHVRCVTLLGTSGATAALRTAVVSKEAERTAPKGFFSFPTQALASKTLPVVAGTLCRCRGGRMM